MITIYERLHLYNQLQHKQNIYNTPKSALSIRYRVQINRVHTVRVNCAWVNLC